MHHKLDLTIMGGREIGSYIQRNGQAGIQDVSGMASCHPYIKEIEFPTCRLNQLKVS